MLHKICHQIGLIFVKPQQHQIFEVFLNQIKKL